MGKLFCFCDDFPAHAPWLAAQRARPAHPQRVFPSSLLFCALLAVLPVRGPTRDCDTGSWLAWAPRPQSCEGTAPYLLSLPQRSHVSVY